MRLSVLAACAMTLILPSCGSDLHRPYPVRGAVFFQGQPAEGAMVTFIPQSERNDLRPAAVVGPDGSFQLSSLATFDGAPAGSYAVTIFYLSPEIKADGQNAGPDLLRGKYSDPKTTPLKVEIKAESNNLAPFRLE